MATQIRRSARRNLDAVRVRAPRRRNDRSDTSGTFTYSSPAGSSSISNSSQTNFFGASSGSYANAMPGVGLEYRYPFVSSSLLGEQIIEPIAQLIVRPNEVLSEVAAQRGRAESRLRRDHPVRVGQIFRLRPRRGRHAAQLRHAVHREFRQRRPRQLRRRPVHPARRAKLATPSATPPTPDWNRGSTKTYSNFVAGETIAPFSSNFSLTSKQQFDSSTFAARSARRDRQRRRSAAESQPRLWAATPRSPCSAGYINARAC